MKKDLEGYLLSSSEACKGDAVDLPIDQHWDVIAPSVFLFHIAVYLHGSARFSKGFRNIVGYFVTLDS
jgi:hypothetical protein